MTPKYTEDKRLLGALDYIDEKFIAEVTESYKIFEPSDGKITAHRTFKISLRQFAALAACIISAGIWWISSTKFPARA